SPAETTTYTVTVTNADGCTATDQVVVKVTAAPTVTITPSGPTTFCEGGFVTLSVNAGSASTYQWLQDGNPINQATSSSFTTHAGGNFSVRVTGSGGCTTTSEEVKVTVNAAPDVVAGTAQSVCNNTPAFTLSGFSPAGGTWSGTGISAAGVFNPATAGVGTHTLTYTVNQNGCSGKATKTITVTPAVAEVGTISGNTTVCAGTANLTYSVPAVAGATTYTWSVPEGFTITAGQGTNSVTVMAGSSSGTIAVKAENGCGASAPKSVAVNVTAAPTPTITAAGSTTFCEGGSVTLSVGEGPGFTYQWYRNGIAISGATGTTYLAEASGSYSVVVANGSCQATAAAIVVNVTSGIRNNTITPGNQTLCAGAAAANLQGSTPTGGLGNYSYQWERSSNGTDFTGIQGATGPDYSPGNLTATTWYRRVVTAGGCSSSSAPVKFTVTPLPTVSLSAFNKMCTENDALTLTGGQPAGGTYSGPGVANGVFDPATAGAGTHTISYTYTDAGNCSATATQTIVVTETCEVTGVEDNEPPYKFVLHPNPTRDKLYLEVELPQRTDVSLRLVDVRGSVILEKNYSGRVGPFSETLHLDHIARGLYILQFTIKQGTYSRRIVLW
ncbi:MAG TPA: T9SS type A sorting domain-containing protein, partial [Pontibacter sp.]